MKKVTIQVFRIQTPMKLRFTIRWMKMVRSEASRSAHLTWSIGVSEDNAMPIPNAVPPFGWLY